MHLREIKRNVSKSKEDAFTMHTSRQQKDSVAKEISSIFTTSKVSQPGW